MTKKIVVIDDEEILIRSFSKLLEKQGYEVFGFKKGADAIAFSEEEEIDLIICDMKMPGQNGVEIISNIYNHLKESGKPVAPVIFITGFADKGLESAAKMFNPIAYIYKPFDIEELIAVVKRAVGK